ncbi:MAG: ABC transporter ATP-binding protein/permease [Clostridia bacterium]|nr:ABC transporter ATP-binding protein/permease [Clostridia bacterium]
MKKDSLRRSGAIIMARLIVLLGSLSYVMVLAVVDGSLGFFCAMGVTLFGALGIAKILGETIALSLNSIVFMCVFCGVLRGGLKFLEQYGNHYIAFRLLAVLRDRVFGALRKLCPAKLESKQKGSIIASITSDIETLEVFYAHTVSPICIAVIVCACVLIFIGVFSSPYLMLTALAGYITVGIILPLISSARMKKTGVEYRAEFASFNSFFLDSIKGIKDIVLSNAGETRKKEVNSRSEKLLAKTKELKRLTVGAQSAVELVVSAVIIAALIVGIVLLNSDKITIGKMIVGVVAVFSSFGPVIAVAALPSNLTQTFAGGDRVLNLIDEKPAVEPVTDGKNIEYENLEVADLSFSYDETKKVLEDVSMHAGKGEIIGIVGESGCGKSTFLKLLLRFWQKKNGTIKYNDTDIDEINSDNLLDNVTMVSQSTYLFDETIENNLRIAKPDATKEEIEDACRLASVHDFIASLPDGYQSRAGLLGDNLSAGEKQRIGLARAFLKGSELILLDEPTSNVDSINEGIILAALARQKKKKSIIIVSHRESTMAIADRVYQVEKGRMEEVV